MMPVQSAISRFRRDMTIGTVLNALLASSVAFCFFGGLTLLFVVLLLWIVLGYHSIKSSRLAAGSTSLIAAGEYEEAEVQIEQALRHFSLFRASKLLSLHHLAVLRHAQKKWHDAAELCQALLRQRLGALTGLSRQSRLILADALLELGDLRGAHEAISGLYSQRLSLAEALSLLHVQLDYLWRINAWQEMLVGLGSKLQLAELMNTASSARTQAMLALAARKTGREDLSTYLRRRVELLTSVDELIKARPILNDLYSAAQSPETKSTDAADAPEQV